MVNCLYCVSDLPKSYLSVHAGVSIYQIYFKHYLQIFTCIFRRPSSVVRVVPVHPPWNRPQLQVHFTQNLSKFSYVTTIGKISATIPNVIKNIFVHENNDF